MIPVPKGFGGELLCRLLLSKFPLWASFVSSVLSLTCVTLERYFSIVHPLRYEVVFTVKKATIMIICVWSMGIVMNSFFLYTYKNTDVGSCALNWPSKAWQTFLGVANFCVIYLIPLTIQGLSYWQIMSNLHKSAMAMRQSLSDGRENQLSRDLLRARKKVIKMLLIVVVTFAICWAPNQFMFFAYMCGWNLDFSAWYYHASVLIAFCNSCVNPFIYGFQSKQYRRAFLQALGSPKCCHNAVGGQQRASGGVMSVSGGTAGIREHYANNNNNPCSTRGYQNSHHAL